MTEDFTPEEIVRLRKILDDAEKMDWLGKILFKWATVAFAIIAGMVAFRNDILQLFWSKP